MKSVSVLYLRALVGVVEKAHSFAALTRTISDADQYPTDTLSLKYSIFLK